MDNIKNDAAITGGGQDLQSSWGGNRSLPSYITIYAAVKLVSPLNSLVKSYYLHTK